jgi:hypothetical protein
MQPESSSLTLVDDARDSVGGAPTRMSIAFRAAAPHGFTVFLSEGPVISCVKKIETKNFPNPLSLKMQRGRASAGMAVVALPSDLRKIINI